MGISTYNPYDAGSSGEESSPRRRASAVQFWIAFAVMLCSYAYMPFIMAVANNPYCPISDELAFLLMIALVATAMLTDRRLAPSSTTRRQWIVSGAIYLVASRASYYVLGVDYLEQSIIPWLTIGMASIHLFNSIVESRVQNSRLA